MKGNSNEEPKFEKIWRLVWLIIREVPIETIKIEQFIPHRWIEVKN